MMENLDEIRADLAAFADDDSDVIVERSGQLLLVKSGQPLSARLSTSEDRLMVAVEDDPSALITYRQFLAQHLARLDILAQKLLDKRPAPVPFVDGPAHLEAVESDSTRGSALTLLSEECRNASPFAARVVFVTADAGHGKTVLLRKYQSTTADAFLKRTCPFVFWHVDLQGRQLLRLSEALMGDLGELRMAGIWMPGIVRLMRHGLVVLGIDGFDELAAEQGSTDALGALASLVSQLGDKGTIVAASRRTFFDTEDYLRRTRMLRSAVSRDCEFDQIHLDDWKREEALVYLGAVQLDKKGFTDPIGTYEGILAELHGTDTHPMLTRPFLLSYVAKGLLRFDVTPEEFIRGMRKPMHGVASVVTAFIEREVSQKWKSRETGEPYLTIDQHMALLGAVAEEMWESQTDRLDIDVLEILAGLRLDAWGVDQDRRRQVLDMVKMHVLLTIPAGAPASMRAFDHPEFRNYFLALCLVERMRLTVSDALSDEPLGKLLAVAQLPDVVAAYAAGTIDRQSFPVAQFLEVLAKLVQREWRPTFLHTNAGTVVPFLLDGCNFSERLVFDAKVVYPSLVFERTKMSNIEIVQGTFLHTSFVGAHWSDVVLRSCELDEVTFDDSALFQRVILENCTINGIVFQTNGEETGREYSPSRITEALGRIGITVRRGDEEEAPSDVEPYSGPKSERSQPTITERRKLVQRLLRAFRRTTALSSDLLRKKFHSDYDVLIRDVIPLMKKHGILNEALWRGRGNQQRFSLAVPSEDVLRADGDDGPEALMAFWKEVDS